MSAQYPQNILTLIACLKKLPGVGSKTAERFAFELLNWESVDLELFGDIVSSIKKNIKKCFICGCIKDIESCYFCSPKRDSKIICIIASAKDAFSIEDTKSYYGLYHVITPLSPTNGYNVDEVNIEKLEKRIDDNNIEEIIIALDSTLEGDATSLFLKNRLEKKEVKISRLAFGIPIGSSLEYIGQETLLKAFSGRQCF